MPQCEALWRDAAFPADSSSPRDSWIAPHMACQMQQACLERAVIVSQQNGRRRIRGEQSKLRLTCINNWGQPFLRVAR